MKKHDFLTIQTSYQNLMQIVSSPKTKAIINKNGGVPRFFVKMLCTLEDFIAERKKDKAAYRKLSKSQGTALNRLGLVYKKHNRSCIA